MPAEIESETETETETVAEDVPPEEGMTRSPLTNEWISGDIEEQRPIAVMVPNDSSALPHYSLSKADILYECPVEGKMSRLMAVFKYLDNEERKRIGNVRSSRDYFVYWAFEWDAIYFHFGGPYYIAPVIEQKMCIRDSMYAFPPIWFLICPIACVFTPSSLSRFKITAES